MNNIKSKKYVKWCENPRIIAGVTIISGAVGAYLGVLAYTYNWLG
ncbi:hypothetical protein I3900191A7_13020 [Clostridium baratii]|uniref:Uncharacterized protein n=1 Tax=Clostridium nitritogenes TaxID=83340 RepID=A0ABN1LMY0_9CLOT|nr:hypothetical protein [Clostridium baratii]